MRTLRTIIRTLLVGLLLAGWLLAAAALHVVRLPDGYLGVVPKDRLALTDTYVDVRAWTPADVAAHPDLVKRLLETHKDWLATTVGVPADELDTKLRQLLAPPEPPPATRPGKAKPGMPHK